MRSAIESAGPFGQIPCLILLIIPFLVAYTVVFGVAIVIVLIAAFLIMRIKNDQAFY